MSAYIQTPPQAVRFKIKNTTREITWERDRGHIELIDPDQNISIHKHSIQEVIDTLEDILKLYELVEEADQREAKKDGPKV